MKTHSSQHWPFPLLQLPELHYTSLIVGDFIGRGTEFFFPENEMAAIIGSVPNELGSVFVVVVVVVVIVVVVVVLAQLNTLNTKLVARSEILKSLSSKLHD